MPMKPSLLLIIMHQNSEYEQRGGGSDVCGQVGHSSTLMIIQDFPFESKTAVNPLKRLNILTHIFCS